MEQQDLIDLLSKVRMEVHFNQTLISIGEKFTKADFLYKLLRS